MNYWYKDDIVNLELLDKISKDVVWNNRMKSRKTASYGYPYNYSGIEYEFLRFTKELQELSDIVGSLLGYKSNNCLLNYYNDGSNKMGYHSDQVDKLEKGTGIAIVSFGVSRLISFKKIEEDVEEFNLELKSGSLFFMSTELQSMYKHAILESETLKPRISFTFRRIKER